MTVSEEGNLGCSRRMKDVREIGVRATAIVKHCIGRKSVVRIVLSGIEIEFILEVIGIIFLFVALDSSTPCNLRRSLNKNKFD